MNENTALLITNAVAPLRSDAVSRAREEASKRVERLVERLITSPNPSEAFPYPSRGKWANGPEEYYAALEDAKLAARIVLPASDTDGILAARHAPHRVVRNQEAIDRHLTAIERDACEQFDTFVTKLVLKVDGHIGPISSAEIDGTSVWYGSTLSVRCARSGEVTRFYTRQVINRSKLGKWFAQFPSRILRHSLRKGTK